MTAIGIFGGTFDPPHYGHLALALAARRHLGLERVLWVLTLQPPHKSDQRLSPLVDRFAMLQATIWSWPEFQLSRVDIDRPPPHYAVDTVRLLHEQFPEAALVYLMGADSLRDLPDWHTPQEFVQACDGLGIMRRPGTVYHLDHLERILPGISAKVQFVDAPLVDISSSALRQRAAAGLPIDADLPTGVAKIIRERGLYQHPPESD